MGIRAHLPKSLTIIGDAPQSASAAGTIPGFDAANAIRLFLTLLTTTGDGGANYRANPFASAQSADEIYEAITGIILSTRSVGALKQPVVTSGQTIVLTSLTAPVQMGQQLQINAGGQAAPATAATQRLYGLAMHDSTADQRVWVVVQGLWFGQVNPGALPTRIQDCTTDASSRVVAGVAGNVANCIMASNNDYTILGRPMRVFNVNRPITLA